MARSSTRRRAPENPASPLGERPTNTAADNASPSTKKRPAAADRALTVKEVDEAFAEIDEAGG